MTTPHAPNPWLLRPPAPRPEALQLLCLPHAGSGAAAFGGWAGALGAGVDIVALQPPGRENRLAEPAHTGMPALIASLLPAVAPLCRAPYAVYGHSMGAHVAFELVHGLLQAGCPLPQLLIVSGARAPHLPALQPLLCDMGDDALLAALEARYGSPVEPEWRALLRLTLPTLRADLCVVETRTPRPLPPLPVPLLVLAGAADAGVPLAEARLWERHGSEGFEFKVFPGGHFFPATQRAAVLACIARALAQQRAAGRVMGREMGREMDVTEVWTVALDAPHRGSEADLACLDAAERARASRYVFAADRRRFIARRAALRRLLAERGGGTAAAIRYASGPFGRPSAIGLPLDFSLSHRGERALIAVAPSGRLGVDIERVAPAQAEAGMLQRWLEPAAWQRCAAALRAGDVQPFFRWWTLVEAVAKARGTGLAEDPPAPAGEAWFGGVELADDAGQPRRWAVHCWQPAAGYVAALAHMSPPGTLRIHAMAEGAA